MNSVEIVIVVSMFGFPCLFTELFIVFFVITSAVMNKIEYVIPIWSANHLQTPIMRSAPPTHMPGSVIIMASAMCYSWLSHRPN